jgi:ribonuclease P protein component
MRKYLRDTAEFQHVYRNGKRFDGVFITAFVIENQELNHRLGAAKSRETIASRDVSFERKILARACEEL